MKSKEGRIFESGNWGRRDKDGRREDEGSIGLADTKMCQGHVKVLRIGELLPLIY